MTDLFITVNLINVHKSSKKSGCQYSQGITTFMIVLCHFWAWQAPNTLSFPVY